MNYLSLENLVSFPLLETRLYFETLVLFSHQLHRPLSLLKRFLNLLSSIQVSVLAGCHTGLFSRVQTISLEGER
jgi:hypothetical protein